MKYNSYIRIYKIRSISAVSTDVAYCICKFQIYIEVFHCRLIIYRIINSSNIFFRKRIIFDRVNRIHINFRKICSHCHFSTSHSRIFISKIRNIFECVCRSICSSAHKNFFIDTIYRRICFVCFCSCNKSSCSSCRIICNYNIRHIKTCDISFRQSSFTANNFQICTTMLYEHSCKFRSICHFAKFSCHIVQVIDDNRCARRTF